MTVWIGDPARQRHYAQALTMRSSKPPSMHAAYVPVSKTSLKRWRPQPVMEGD